MAFGGLRYLHCLTGLWLSSCKRNSVPTARNIYHYHQPGTRLSADQNTKQQNLYNNQMDIQAAFSHAGNIAFIITGVLGVLLGYFALNEFLDMGFRAHQIRHEQFRNFDTSLEPAPSPPIQSTVNSEQAASIQSRSRRNSLFETDGTVRNKYLKTTEELLLNGMMQLYLMSATSLTD